LRFVESKSRDKTHDPLTEAGLMGEGGDINGDALSSTIVSVPIIGSLSNLKLLVVGMVMVINVDLFPGNVVPLASVLGFFIIRTESYKGIPVSTRIVVDVLN